MTTDRERELEAMLTWRTAQVAAARGERDAIRQAVEAVRDGWAAGWEPVHHKGYIADLDRALASSATAVSDGAGATSEACGCGHERTLHTLAGWCVACEGREQCDPDDGTSRPASPVVAPSATDDGTIEPKGPNDA